MSDTPPVETVESGTDDSRNNNADPNVNPIPESIGTTVDHGDSYNVESAWEGATHFVRFSHVSEEKSDDVHMYEYVLVLCRLSTSYIVQV